ncbi:hypothetical protein DAMNIGENAA_02280 [Desulforhabdus amnigena]|uniref:Uncharacterized protein n=1 Tax=Desulforhabdus amnigena TaxID=40218 RepID=A0A9W6FT06_9BACT|nr:hypothetical protein DAMNIGENAA_02280 [Desulforhabdus amnigena]
MDQKCDNAHSYKSQSVKFVFYCEVDGKKEGYKRTANIYGNDGARPFLNVGNDMPYAEEINI